MAMRRPRLELAIFDLVGTAVVAHDAVSRAIERSSRGSPASEAARTGARRCELERALLMHYASPGACSAVRGIPSLFDALRAGGARVALVTPLPAVVADHILDRLGWVADGLVDLRVAADEVPRSDYAVRARLLAEAMRRAMQSEPRAVAAIGASAEHLEAAASLGCGWNIAAGWGGAPHLELVHAPLTARAADPSEVCGVLFARDRPSSTRAVARLRRCGDEGR